jgi:hypothetical protein
MDGGFIEEQANSSFSKEYLCFYVVQKECKKALSRATSIVLHTYDPHCLL